MIHYLSTYRWTCGVETDERDVITRGPPLLRKFLGQPIGNLLKWADRIGGLIYEH